MNAAELVSLVAPHGVDLKHVAGCATEKHGTARKRKRSPLEVRLGIDVTESVQGHESRTYRQPKWSVAELAQAAQGLDQIPWYAARYSFAGDVSCYWTLWSALAFETQRLARREGWQPQVLGADRNPKYYQQELAQLVLDVDAHRHVFATAPTLYATYMRVAPDTWNRVLAPRLEALQARYEAWLGQARATIQAWLREDEDVAA